MIKIKKRNVIGLAAGVIVGLIIGLTLSIGFIIYDKDSQIREFQRQINMLQRENQNLREQIIELTPYRDLLPQLNRSAWNLIARFYLGDGLFKTHLNVFGQARINCTGKDFGRIDIMVMNGNDMELWVIHTSETSALITSDRTYLGTYNLILITTWITYAQSSELLTVTIEIWVD